MCARKKKLQSICTDNWLKLARTFLFLIVQFFSSHEQLSDLVVPAESLPVPDLEGDERVDELRVGRHLLDGDGPRPPDVVQEAEHPLAHAAVIHHVVPTRGQADQRERERGGRGKCTA